jgi:hypothetical protein
VVLAPNLYGESRAAFFRLQSTLEPGKLNFITVATPQVTP